MRGFPAEYEGLPDFIIKITKQIWEDRGLATLRENYAKDIIVRMPSGIDSTSGNAGVITGTLATLAEFPDRQLLAEDVIWSGDEDRGFMSSHRILTTGTQTGHGAFGLPSGKSFVIRAVADCAAKNDKIDDEWLVRDAGGICVQLGLDPCEYARDEIARQGGPERCSRPFHPSHDIAGPYDGRGNDNCWGVALAAILQRIMACDFAVIREEYDRAACTEHWCARSGFSYDFPETSWMQLRSSFPTAAFEIHHQIGRSDSGMPNRAAVRWSLTGTHSGTGYFGAPTGAEVHIMVR